MRHVEQDRGLPTLYGPEATACMTRWTYDTYGQTISQIQMQWIFAHRDGRWQDCADLRAIVDYAAMVTLHQWA